MTKAIKGAEAIYFTAGSGTKDLLQVDAFGAVKLMQAAEKDSIMRFVMLSELFSLEPTKWRTVKGLDGLAGYNITNFFTDNYLIHDTDLDYTILQPTVMTDKPGTGKIIKMREGDTPIDDALSRV